MPLGFTSNLLYGIFCIFEILVFEQNDIAINMPAVNLIKITYFSILTYTCKKQFVVAIFWFQI